MSDQQFSNAIAQQWAEFAERYVPAEASQAQRDDMRRAFYAGFIACLAFQMTQIATIEDEDEAERAVQAIIDEGQAFAAELREPPPPFRHPRL